MLRRSAWLRSATLVPARPLDRVIATTHKTAMSFMQPSTLRLAVLTRIMVNSMAAWVGSRHLRR